MHRCNNNNDTISTFYGAVPIVGCGVNRMSIHNSRNSRDHDRKITGEYIETAIEKIKEKEPVSDDLDLKLLLRLFL